QSQSQSQSQNEFTPWIWFLKFPLDERGLLSEADMGNFLRYVTGALGVRLGAQLSEEEQQQLADNPYTFKPSDDKMAMFHSLVAARFNMPASSYYPSARQYFQEQDQAASWQSIGLQGITDMCARLNQDNNRSILRHALTWLTQSSELQPPTYALLGALEHAQLTENLAEKLADLALAEANKATCDIFLLAAFIRALGSHQAQLNRVVSHVLASPLLSHQEVLIAIAGRSWRCLTDQELAQTYLTRLAQVGEQGIFNQVFADLVMLPELRLILLPLIYSPATPELERALNQLTAQTKQTQTERS
ncbi:MAG: DUF3549 family protein, partial [Vibrio sp.]